MMMFCCVKEEGERERERKRCLGAFQLICHQTHSLESVLLIPLLHLYTTLWLYTRTNHPIEQWRTYNVTCFIMIHSTCNIVLLITSFISLFQRWRTFMQIAHPCATTLFTQLKLHRAFLYYIYTNNAQCISLSHLYLILNRRIFVVDPSLQLSPP